MLLTATSTQGVFKGLQGCPDCFITPAPTYQKGELTTRPTAILLSSIDPLVFLSIRPRYAGPVSSDRVWKNRPTYPAAMRWFCLGQPYRKPRLLEGVYRALKIPPAFLSALSRAMSPERSSERPTIWSRCSQLSRLLHINSTRMREGSEPVHAMIAAHPALVDTAEW